MRSGRAGFSLMELVVVMLIIAVLASLTAAGVFAVISSQRVSNTKSTLNKLTPILKLQWNAVAEQAAREWDNSPATRTKFLTTYVTPIAGSSASPGLQRVIYVKLKLVQTFPMSFDEVLMPASSSYTSPNMLPALTAYKKKLQAQGITGSNSTTGPYESSALLLMALQEGISGQKLNPDDLGNSSLVNFSAGTGTLQALVDGWGSPVAFFRWPTANTDLNPGSLPQAGTNHDLTDPQGYLTSTSWLGSPYPSKNVTAFASAIGYTPPAQGGSGAQSYTLAPLLVSPGPDMALGMSSGSVNTGIDPNATTDATGNATDNVSSAAQ
jgi:prepilin-type N-terminal cleavage/methylation domain-containing protein